MEKLMLLQIPDHIYNWVASYFEGHTHCTKHGGVISEFLEVSAGVFQGSGMGPSLFNIAASDLKTIPPTNKINKYTDDSNLIIPSSNILSTEEELYNVEKWA